MGADECPPVAWPGPAFVAWPVKPFRSRVCGGSRRHTGQGAMCRCTCVGLIDVRYLTSGTYRAARKSSLCRISRRKRLRDLLPGDRCETSRRWMRTGAGSMDFTRSDACWISGSAEVVPRRRTCAEFFAVNRAEQPHGHFVRDPSADRVCERSSLDETVSGHPPVPAVTDRLDRRLATVAVRVRRGRGVSRRTCAWRPRRLRRTRR